MESVFPLFLISLQFILTFECIQKFVRKKVFLFCVGRPEETYQRRMELVKNLGERNYFRFFKIADLFVISSCNIELELNEKLNPCHHHF